MTRRIIIAGLGVLALAGCGQQAELQRPEGAAPVPKAAAATTAPTTAELLTPRTQERPDRSEEILRQSEERRDDRFDLPPAG